MTLDVAHHLILAMRTCEKLVAPMRTHVSVFMTVPPL